MKKSLCFYAFCVLPLVIANRELLRLDTVLRFIVGSFSSEKLNSVILHVDEINSYARSPYLPNAAEEKMKVLYGLFQALGGVTFGLLIAELFLCSNRGGRMRDVPTSASRM